MSAWLALALLSGVGVVGVVQRMRAAFSAVAVEAIAVELTEEDLNVHQVVDSTRIAVASLVLTAWSVFWITRTIRAFRRS